MQQGNGAVLMTHNQTSSAESKQLREDTAATLLKSSNTLKQSQFGKQPKSARSSLGNFDSYLSKSMSSKRSTVSSNLD